MHTTAKRQSLDFRGHSDKDLIGQDSEVNCSLLRFLRNVLTPADTELLYILSTDLRGLLILTSFP